MSFVTFRNELRHLYHKHNSIFKKNLLVHVLLRTLASTNCTFTCLDSRLLPNGHVQGYDMYNCMVAMEFRIVVVERSAIDFLLFTWLGVS